MIGMGFPVSDYPLYGQWECHGWIHIRLKLDRKICLCDRMRFGTPNLFLQSMWREQHGMYACDVCKFGGLRAI